jgi:hypothetical protein
MHVRGAWRVRRATTSVLIAGLFRVVWLAVVVQMRVQRATTDDCESLRIRVGAYACVRCLARVTRDYTDIRKILAGNYCACVLTAIGRMRCATTDECESLRIHVSACVCARRLARATRPYGDGDDLKTCISNSKVITRISTASHQNPQKLSGLSASVVNQNTAIQTRISPIEAVQHLTKNLKNSVDSVPRCNSVSKNTVRPATRGVAVCTTPRFVAFPAEKENGQAHNMRACPCLRWGLLLAGASAYDDIVLGGEVFARYLDHALGVD